MSKTVKAFVRVPINLIKLSIKTYKTFEGGRTPATLKAKIIQP